MIELTNKLTVVLVPEDSYNFNYSSGYLYYISSKDDLERELDFSNTENNFNILGTIEKLGEFDFEFSFDCSKYVEKHELGYGYKDYVCLDSKAPLDNKEDSFLTLLDSKEIFIEELNKQKLLILEKI